MGYTELAKKVLKESQMEKLIKSYEVPNTCHELQMMHIINEVMIALAPDERVRAIEWVADKYGVFPKENTDAN